MATAKKRTKKAAPKTAKESTTAQVGGRADSKKASAKGKKTTRPPATDGKKAAAKKNAKAAKKSSTTSSAPAKSAKAAKKSSMTSSMTSSAPAKAAKTSSMTSSAPAKVAKSPAPAPKKSAKADKKADRAARKAAKSAGKAAGKATATRPARRDVQSADPALFAPLCEGERADALRVLNEDPRLASMTKVGRYRVIAVEPLAVKSHHELAGRRLVRVVIYDYAADRSVDACVDPAASTVPYLDISQAQPMLAREEEAAAIAISLSDDGVKSQLSLGDEPLVTMHYWSRDDTRLSYKRRSAAVIFGRPDAPPSLVAVVDLVDNLVCEIVPATQW